MRLTGVPIPSCETMAPVAAERVHTAVPVDAGDAPMGHEAALVAGDGLLEAGRVSSIAKVDDQLAVSCVGLNYSVPVKDQGEAKGPLGFGKGSLKEKLILRDISATFRSGRLTAIMGASGAGKTSLLNLLGGEIDLSKPGTRVSGRIFVNGKEVQPHDLKQVSEFVFQDDLIFETMTVREAITMSATLRLPSHVTKAERRQRVRDIIKMLNLEKCADTIIGSAARKGISGGERKRCAIAMDLITNPPVLFLDEPTSGLDTFTAYNVMACLADMAHQHGRTVVATVHQPSSEIFHLLDDLLLLSGGRVAYCGEVASSVGYFASLGFPCPQYNNPADYFFMEVLNETVPRRWAAQGSPEADPCARVSAVLARWLESESARAPASASLGLKDAGKLLPVKQRASFPAQFWLLLQRSGRNVWRNKMVARVRFFQSAFVALVIGALYFDVSKSADYDVQRMNRTGALHFLIINQFMSSATSVVTIFTLEKNVFKREHDAGYYTLPAYFFSKIIVETPHQVFFPFLVMTIAYWLIGLRASFSHYVVAVLGAVLTSLNGMALGILAGSLFKDLNVGMAILMVILMPMMLFTGFLVNNASVHRSVRWLQYLSPTKYTFSALMQNEFAGLTFKNCDPASPRNAINQCRGEHVLEAMSISGGLSIFENHLVVVCTYLLLLSLAYLALFRLTRQH